MKGDVSVFVQGLTVKFDQFIAVDDISFTASEGEIFGFLGANGAGKTTTIRVLCGLLHPTSGKVMVGGIKFKDDTDEMFIKRKVGYMSQKFTLYNDLTVDENLLFNVSLRNLDPKIYKERRDYILNFISFKRPLNTFVKDLPGGIKQQVSLAACLLHDPEIIFLDEPTAGVTPAMRARFWSLIRDLVKLNKTIFVTTHYMDEAEQCDRIALMRAGKIIAMDTPTRLKQLTFSGNFYELTPKGNLEYAEIEALRHHPELDYFEPVGLRFHVTFKNPASVQGLRKTFSKDFDIKEISPTLEDVFIRAVEEKPI